MKGLTIMTDESSGRRIAQLGLTLLSKNSAQLEDVFDLLIAESRKDEKEFSWGEIRKDLKSKGRM